MISKLWPIFKGRVRIALLLLCGAILVWLACSESPTSRRISRINALVANGRLGKVEPALQKRLEEQFRWLARHAGVQEDVAVNQPIRAHQVTLIVTEPEYASLTNCGPGNAIYDPALQTIFVDHALVWPTESLAIGTPSVNTMFTIDTVGYVASYTSFILAHELGHWQKHDRSSAFFHYGWNQGDAPAGEELEADRAAIRTVLAGNTAADVPSTLKGLSALPVLGLSGAEFPPDQRAAVDLAVGVLQMSDDLLFASGPYSPYHSDRSHPDLLARMQSALQQLSFGKKRASFGVQTRLLQAQLERYAALKGWRYRELFFPGPLTAVDVRANALWLGRTDIPKMDRESASKQLDEQLYRIPLQALIVAQANAPPFDLPRPVLVGRSKVGEAYNYAENEGDWVTEKFERGDPTIGLPPPSFSTDPQRETEWGPSQWGGLQKIGMAWIWPARGKVPAGRLTERVIAERLRVFVPPGAQTLGKMQWAGDSLAIPVSVIGPDGRAMLRIFALRFATGTWQLREQPEFGLTLPTGVPEAAAATFWREGWWIPVRLGVGRTGERFELWNTGQRRQQRYAARPLLIGLATQTQIEHGIANLQPSDPRLLPITATKALFGFDHDSLYLVDAAKGEMRVIFHPARWGLRVLDLGGGRVLFWMLHARKAYLIDTN